jgi:hypothetical protein
MTQKPTAYQTRKLLALAMHRLEAFCLNYCGSHNPQIQKELSRCKAEHDAYHAVYQALQGNPVELQISAYGADPREEK